MGALSRSARSGRYPQSTEVVDLYLLHFSRPLSHAQHYLGVAYNGVDRRVAEHQRGKGARITRAAVAAGIELVLARTWLQVSRSREVALKGRFLRPKCPICSPEGRSDL